MRMNNEQSSGSSDQIIHLRITKEDKEEIRQKAKNVGMSISEYIRYVSLKYNTEDYLRRDILERKEKTS